MNNKNLNHEIIDGVMTAIDGTFGFNDNKVSYVLIQFIGFKTKKIILNEKDLRTITLNEKQENLKTVTIKARKDIVKQKVDRLLLDYKNTTSSKGGTAIDALMHTPGVTIDNENLNIIGKGTVGILINNRLVRMSQKEFVSYLNSISSDDIDTIEVITSPPAKYEAEANGGLINIILKKNKVDSWSYQLRTSLTRGIALGGNIGNTLNYNKRNVNFSLNLNGKLGNNIHQNGIIIEYPNNIWDINSEMKLKNDLISCRLNLNYKLTYKDRIGFIISSITSQNGGETKMKTLVRDNKGTYLKNSSYTKGIKKIMQ